MKSKYKLMIKGIALLGIVGLLSSCGGGANPYVYKDLFGIPHLNSVRGYHTATLLGDDTVLITGGYNGGAYVNTFEYFY